MSHASLPAPEYAWQDCRFAVISAALRAGMIA
jgi:hypothetical protein